VVAMATEDAASRAAKGGKVDKADDGSPALTPPDTGDKALEEVTGTTIVPPLAGEAADERIAIAAPLGSDAALDAAHVALVAQRLTAAEKSLSRWGYATEVVYTWLGVISLGIASFSAFSHGSNNIHRSPVMALGPLSVGLSLLCSLIGWFQARSSRSVARRCGMAASSLEPGGPAPPATQLLTIMPALGDIESGLRVRQRTAWLGVMFAVVGMQSMVGLLVAKVLVATGGLSPSPGVSLDVFTLLAVTNAALSHVIGGCAVVLQQGALPPSAAAAGDPFRGWGRR